MRRGDLVTVIVPGAYGKPRPALVVQSDLFQALPSVTVVPITSERHSAPLFRIDLEPDAQNGLAKPSQAMVDKLQTVPREKVGQVFGHVHQEKMLEIVRSLSLFLGIA
ncbi:MAG: type II toxin-antitoxin system PemK/MazF family toxin [Desulfovibrionaceae bacterium]|nr:type II toxin-antitoxin system PemK/MazF family toxin [Desulfovibrionaceae bacterium]